jgi:hypothetical protein
LLCFGLWTLHPAIATAKLTDDRYDGNIFVLYAGNGSLVPTNETLAQALSRERAVMLVFFVDDSRDCKDYALVVSRVQERYGRRTSILPINVDAIAPRRADADAPEAAFTAQEAGFYYREAGVPQTVILNPAGDVRFDATGVQSFEQLDTVLREVFDLEQVTPPQPPQRQEYNEFNAELTD